MRVFGLSGKSGTGKSFQAIRICREREIESLIDDGLFILNNKIEAGHSAKRDNNKITAIRTAIFDNPVERATVSERIRELAPDSILVIGTSDAMVLKICRRLELPEPEEIMHIEDVADNDEITTALRQRQEKGRHVIPVPTVEVQPQFSGYFMAPFRALFNWNGKLMQEEEKSIVRPTYSYLGKYYISNGAVNDMIHYAASGCDGVSDILKCTADVSSEGVILNISAIFEMNPQLRDHIEHMQEIISSDVFRMTSFNILAVNVTVKGLK